VIPSGSSKPASGGPTGTWAKLAEGKAKLERFEIPRG
jgi:hypothetical protein